MEYEISKINQQIEKSKQNIKNVDEFIERVKKYIQAPTLTREMTMELIEFVTIDKFRPKKDPTPREIHIYYKLIDDIDKIDFKRNCQKKN